MTSTRSRYLLYCSAKTPQKFNNIVAEIMLDARINYTELHLHTYMKRKMPQELQIRKRYVFRYLDLYVLAFCKEVKNKCLTNTSLIATRNRTRTMGGE